MLSNDRFSIIRTTKCSKGNLAAAPGAGAAVGLSSLQAAEPAPTPRAAPAAPSNRPRAAMAAVSRPADCRTCRREGKRGTLTVGSVLDAFLGRDALVEGVLHLAHLGDRVGRVDDLLRRVAAGDDHVGLRRPVGQGVDDVG